MSIERLSRAGQDAFYTQAAYAYMAALPLEHFMESLDQSTQRKITVASLELVVAQRPDVHVFNEMLIQWPIAKQKRPGQIVPDNMVAVHEGSLEVETHYTIPLQPVSPLWVLEYVSKSSQRKDYGSSLEVYERSLRIPYYLTFHPDADEMILFRLNSRRRYRAIAPDRDGRCAIPELELEVGMLDRWVRFWFRGELLPLPGDLQRELQQTRQELIRTEERLLVSEQQRSEAEQRQIEAEQRQVQAEERQILAEQALAQERAARAALEAELARLRGQLPDSSAS